MIRASDTQPFLEDLPIRGAPTPDRTPAPSRGHSWSLDVHGHAASCERCDAKRFVRLRINDRNRLVATIEATGPEKCPITREAPPPPPPPRVPGTCSNTFGEHAEVMREWGGDWYLPRQNELFTDHVRHFHTCGSDHHRGDSPRGVAVCRGWRSYLTGDAPACELVELVEGELVGGDQ